MSQKKKTTTLVKRERDGRELKRSTIYLPSDLAKQLERHCRSEGRQLSFVVTQAVRQYLKE